jgi:lysozyme
MGLFAFIAQLLRDASASAPNGPAAAPIRAIQPDPHVASEVVPMPTQIPLPIIQPQPVEPDWLKLCRPMTQHFESCYLVAYCDPASEMAKALQEAGLWYKYLANRAVALDPKFNELDGRPWSVGYGATRNGIGRDTVWTQDQANADLTRRLTAIGISIDQLVSVSLLPHQKAALGDFTYNEGEHRLATSTMLKRLNDKNFGEAMAELIEFNLASGKKLQGLVDRREAEKTLFTEGSWHP